MSFAHCGEQAVETGKDFPGCFQGSGALGVVDYLRDLRRFDSGVFAVG
jgi:hypothetical protein